MKVLAMSDQHGYLPSVEPCDLLLIAGDICPITNHSLDFQTKWLDNEFRGWLDNIPAENIVLIAGNHDLVFEQTPDKVPDLPCVYLQDSLVEIEGLKIWGTPWIVPIWGAFMGPDFPELELRFKEIPSDVDIIVSHGPPAGVGDRVISGERVGSQALATTLYRVAPKLCVFGHIHEARDREQFDHMTLANVSVVNVMYELSHPPMEFKLELDEIAS